MKISTLFRQLAKAILTPIISIWLLFLGKKKLGKINSILFINLYPTGIGDLHMSTPSFRAVRQKYPKAKITLLTDKTILERNDVFNKVIVVKKGKHWKEYKNLKGTPDMIVLCQKNLLQSIFALAIRKKYILGYLNSWKVKANFKIENLEYTPDQHYYKTAFLAVKPLGVKKIGWNIERLGFNSKESLKIKKLIRGPGDKTIVINPYVIWKSRTWPAENYVSVIKNLIKKNKIVITGGPDDVEYNKYFDNYFEGDPNYHNLTGKISLFELAALCNLSNLFLTGDAGPMHIAFSEKTQTLALFGVTDPMMRLPLNRVNKDCHFIYPENHPEANTYNLEYEPKSESINAISPKEVIKKVRELL